MAAYVTEANFTPLVGAPSEDTAWGYSFSGSRKLWDQDTFYFQITYGDGIEKFRSQPGFEIDPAGELFAVPAIAWFVGYEHRWTERLRSVVTYSAADVDYPAGFADQVDALEYASVNLLWTPTKQTQFGLEYLYGSRTDQDGAFGHANRLQFGAWLFLR